MEDFAVGGTVAFLARKDIEPLRILLGTADVGREPLDIRLVPVALQEAIPDAQQRSPCRSKEPTHLSLHRPLNRLTSWSIRMRTAFGVDG